MVIKLMTIRIGIDYEDKFKKCIAKMRASNAKKRSK